MKAAVLGSVLDDVGSIISGLPPIISQVLEDPALPEVLGLVDQIVQEEASRPSSTPSGPGVGLQSAVLPLKAFLFYRQHPVVTWAGVVGLFAVPLLLGVVIGRRVARG